MITQSGTTGNGGVEKKGVGRVDSGKLERI